MKNSKKSEDRTHISSNPISSMMRLSWIFTFFAHIGIRFSRTLLFAAFVFVAVSVWFIADLRLEADAAEVFSSTDKIGRAYRSNQEIFGEQNQLVLILDFSESDDADVDELTEKLASQLRGMDDIRFVKTKPFP